MSQQSPQFRPPGRRASRPTQFREAKRADSPSQRDSRLLVMRVQRGYFSPYATRQ